MKAVLGFLIVFLNRASATCDASAYATCVSGLGTAPVTTNVTEICEYVGGFYSCYGAADCCDIVEGASAAYASWNCTVTCSDSDSTGQISGSSSFFTVAATLNIALVMWALGL